MNVHPLTGEPFPSRVEERSGKGKSLVAAGDVARGTMVQRFQGPDALADVKYDECDEDEKRYVLNYLHAPTGEWRWLSPQSNSRYINHACEPNATLNRQREVILLRDLHDGEEITFVYNNGDSAADYWDPLWTFKCGCGSARCQGSIDQYRPFNEEAWAAELAKRGGITVALDGKTAVDRRVGSEATLL
ncbi:hypothetical protein HK101_005966 [Irineochytrium annulatum]|nr:hypothetical protein HK101_005966 [Irineochytrium annulatum]